MASSNDVDDTGAETLAEQFNKGLDLYNKICNSDAPTNSLEMQLDVKSAMRTFEQATRLVSIAGIFSSNEGIEEVATDHLQYLLLPALLGHLSLKLTTGERKQIIDTAEIYYNDFLSRCNDYDLTNYESHAKIVAKQPQTEIEQITASVNSRVSKIHRFREQKELKAKMASLKSIIDSQHADEELKRDYFVTMLKSFVHEAIGELESIEMERPILEHLLKTKGEDKPAPKRPPAPLKPVIIARDEQQKAVYGAGYPSLATFTVAEFYEKRVQDGVFPAAGKGGGGGMNLQQAALAGVELFDEEQEAADTEKLVEEDDEENVERMRRMDDYKDEHRRGWGNRMNRS